MNFDWTEDEAAFRAQVRQLIEEHKSPDWGPHDFELSTPELRRQCTEFCRVLAAEGLLTPNWPREYGGREASPWEQLIKDKKGMKR